MIKETDAIKITMFTWFASSVGGKKLRVVGYVRQDDEIFLQTKLNKICSQQKSQ